MVVLSPPGITNPSRPSSSSARRTSRASAPSCSSTTRCSRKSPCRARTPTVRPAPGPSRSRLGSGDRIQSSRRVPLLALMPPSGSPAAMLDLGFFGHARDVDAGHRLADAALMMQLGAEGVFVGSGIFKSEDPQKRANAIVKATTNYRDAKIIAEVSVGLGDD